MAQVATTAHSHLNNTTQSWLEWLARAGYAARGVVYIIVGALALLAATGSGGDTTGSHGALQTLADDTGGQIVLGFIAAGLFGHAVWRFLQSVLDADGHGTDGKAMLVRGGLFASAIAYLLLAIYAASLIVGGVSRSSGEGNAEATAWLMSKPFGLWLVGLAGVAVIGAGVAQFVKGAKATFEKWLKLNPSALEKVSPICRFGLMARGLVFWIIGAFLIVAAVQADPQEAKGLGGALDTLRDQPYGPWLLGAVALGLLAFAVYSFIEAGYRRINPSKAV